MSNDRSLSVVLLVFCSIMYFETFSFAEKTEFQTIGPTVFPRAIIIFIAVLAVINLLMTFKKKTEKRQFNRDEFILNYGKVIAVFALFAVYVIALSLAGFIPATLLFLIVGQALLMGFKKPKIIISNLLVSFISTFTVHIIFTNFLAIWLP